MTDDQKYLFFEAGWYAAIDAAIKETESLTGDKATASSGLSRTFKTMSKLKKLRGKPNEESKTDLIGRVAGQ